MPNPLARSRKTQRIWPCPRLPASDWNLAGIAVFRPGPSRLRSPAVGSYLPDFVGASCHDAGEGFGELNLISRAIMIDVYDDAPSAFRQCPALALRRAQRASQRN